MTDRGPATDPEALWSDLLSGEDARILRAWATLGREEQSAVKLHLQSMAGEAGWQPGQRRAAQAALRCIAAADGP